MHIFQIDYQKEMLYVNAIILQVFAVLINTVNCWSLKSASIHSQRLFSGIVATNCELPFSGIVATNCER